MSVPIPVQVSMRGGRTRAVVNPIQGKKLQIYSTEELLADVAQNSNLDRCQALESIVVGPARSGSAVENRPGRNRLSTGSI